MINSFPDDVPASSPGPAVTVVSVTVVGVWVPNNHIVNAQVKPQMLATTIVITVKVSPALLPNAL